MNVFFPGIVASGTTGHLNTWAPTSAYDSLGVVTLASTAASITFTGIPSGYKHLQIRGISLRSGSSGSYLNIRFNNDSGSNYSWHQILGDGSSTFVEYGASATSGISDWTFGTGNPAPIIYDILDYTNTSKNKTIKNLGGWDNNGSGYVGLTSGAWYSTAPISSITITPNAGNFATYSSFALYGVK